MSCFDNQVHQVMGLFSGHNGQNVSVKNVAYPLGFLWPKNGILLTLVFYCLLYLEGSNICPISGKRYLADFQCKTDCQVIMFWKYLFNSEYAVKNKSLNERYES